MSSLSAEVTSYSNYINDVPADIVSEQTKLIFQWICYAILGQIIAIFGIGTNIINIICFIKQGFKDPVNVSLLGLAISDFCSLATVTWTNICYNPAFNNLDLPFDAIDIQLLSGAWPHVTFTHVTSWITAFITVERCLCVTMPLKVKTIITTNRAAIIIAIIYVVLIAAVSPIYCISSYGNKFSTTRNKTVLGIIHTKNRQDIEAITHALNNVFIPIGAFITVIICTIILVLNLRMKMKWRQQSVTSKQSENLSHRDIRVTNMVTMISVLFIVCFFPVCAFVVSMLAVPQLSLDGIYINTIVVIFSFGFLLESTNAAMNIFIYYHMSSKFKEVFRQLLPFKN